MIPSLKFYCYGIHIKCQIHGRLSFDYNYKNIFEIYNELSCGICELCGTKNNLFFNKKKLIYICQKCLKNKNHYLLIDMNDIFKCIKHKKDLIYTFNKCEDCLKELEEMNKDDKKDNEDNDDNDDDNDDNNEVDRSQKNDEKNEFKIVIKRTPEKLENILFTNEEINKLKEKIKIIEDKVKSFNSEKKNIWDTEITEISFF